ncbi:MAG: type II toxin-antitoxin system HicB family antitoxin [Candidatus Eremiobacteraeota bacterium]|nr:type II toxin-antitoxin system HicB family antitoxin [Candidatus Eremiobacteraeota bacterium]
MLQYPAIVHEESDGYWVEFPDLKGCVTEGDTMKELIENGEDALSLYLGVLFDDGMEIPEPSSFKADNIIYVSVLPDTAIPIVLRKMRIEKQLSQSDIAKKIGKSYQAYQKFENVKKFNARIKTLEYLARSLGKKLIVDFVDY